MKKLFSITAAGIAVMAIASSAFAATPATTTSSATQQVPFDHPYKHKGQLDNQELLSLLKVDATTLQQELKAGKSLADIAAAQGVEEQKVIDLMVKQASERLDQAVQAGKLTQNQADQRKAKLQDQIKDRVENKGGFGLGKHDGFGGRGGHFGDVASVLGINEQELHTQLQSGKTLAQIAQDKGISKDDLINQLLQKEKERLTQMVDQTWPQKDNAETANTQQTN
jgi:ribosomal protein S20